MGSIAEVYTGVKTFCECEALRVECEVWSNGIAFGDGLKEPLTSYFSLLIPNFSLLTPHSPLFAAHFGTMPLVSAWVNVNL